MRDEFARTGVIPQALQDKPEIEGDFLFIWRAFWELTLSRHIGFSGPGFIPLTEIAVYCEMWEIYGEQRDLLMHVIRRLDIDYIALTSVKASSTK